MHRYISLFLFLVLVVGGGSLIGISNEPGQWYAALRKPPFNPPNWIFAPVWTTLYVFIAVAGWRTFQSAPRSGRMMLWGAQLIFNLLWTPVFFGFHLMALGLLVILLLLVTIVAFAVVAWRSDRLSAMLFVPYAVWVSFAALLNLSLLWLN